MLRSSEAVCDEGDSVGYDADAGEGCQWTLVAGNRSNKISPRSLSFSNRSCRHCYDGRTAMPFIPPMLATRLEDPHRLADPRYSAEPKLDGQRAQLHVRAHRTVHAFSRPGRELITLPGLAWLRELRWPVASAVLDGEAVAGDGSEGIQAVFEARTWPGSPKAFLPFDLLRP